MAPRRKKGEQETESRPAKQETRQDSLIPPSRTDSIGQGIGSSRASLPRNDEQGQNTEAKLNVQQNERFSLSSPPSSPASPSPSFRKGSTSKLEIPSKPLLPSSPKRRKSEPGPTTSSEGRTSSLSVRSVSSGSKRRRTGSDAGIAGAAESSQTTVEADGNNAAQLKRLKEGTSRDRLETGRSSGSRHSAEELSNRFYALRVLQGPTTGSAFGTNLLARLALAPPLVVELTVTDSNGDEIPASDELSHFVCHVALMTDTGQAADLLSPVSTPSNSPTNTSSSNPTPPSRRVSLARRASRRTSGGSSRSRSSGESQRSAPESPSGPLRMLYGTLVASPQQLSTPDSVVRCLFLFPEVSVRARGRYRLQVTLMRIPL